MLLASIGVVKERINPAAVHVSDAALIYDDKPASRSCCHQGVTK